MINPIPPVQGANPIDDNFLNLAFDGLRSQLTLTQRRIKGDDLDNRAIANCLSQLDQLQADFSQRLNYESDEYNQLMDYLDQLKAALSESTELVGSLQTFKDQADSLLAQKVEAAQDEAHTAHREADKARNETAGIKAAMSQMDVTHRGEVLRLETTISELIRNHKIYQRNNPETLTKDVEMLRNDVSRLRKERREDGELRRTMQTTLNNTVTELTNTRKREKEVTALNSKQAAANQHAQIVIEDLTHKLSESVGKKDVTTHETKTANGKIVNIYIHTLPFQMGSTEALDLDDRDLHECCGYHWQLRTSHLMDMSVLSSPWGRPIFRVMPHLEQYWNESITDDLHHRIELLYQKSFPKLYQRICDGKNAGIAELKFSTRTANLLTSNGLTTVCDVASLTAWCFASLTGCGETIKTEILNAVRTWELEWEAVNGAPESTRNRELVVRGDGQTNRAMRRKIDARVRKLKK